jgi:hypothetical protein
MRRVLSKATWEQAMGGRHVMRVCVEKVDVNVREHEVVQDTSTCAFNVDVSLESQPANK